MAALVRHLKRTGSLHSAHVGKIMEGVDRKFFAASSPETAAKYVYQASIESRTLVCEWVCTHDTSYWYVRFYQTLTFEAA